MCRTTNIIHRQKSWLDLTNEKIAERMRGDGIQVTGDAVQKYFGAGSGVPLDNLGSFLRALGLKVVTVDTPDIGPEEFKALKMFAGKYLTGNDPIDS